MSNRMIQTMLRNSNPEKSAAKKKQNFGPTSSLWKQNARRCVRRNSQKCDLQLRKCVLLFDGPLRLNKSCNVGMKILTVLLDQLPSSCQFAQGSFIRMHMKDKCEICFQLLLLLLLPRLTLLRPCTGAELVEYEEVIRWSWATGCLPSPPLHPLPPLFPPSFPFALVSSPFPSTPSSTPPNPQALTSEVGVPLYQKLLREIHGNHHLESHAPPTHPLPPPPPPLNENNHYLLIVDSHKGLYLPCGLPWLRGGRTAEAHQGVQI